MEIASLPRKIIQYFKEVKTETKKVNWPTRNAALRYTMVVIVIVVFVSVFLGFFDIIFTFIMKTFII